MPLVADDQFFFQFEKKLLETQQLQSLSDLPSLDRSKLVVLSHEVKDGVITCSLGERVKIRADLVDELGKVSAIFGMSVFVFPKQDSCTPSRIESIRYASIYSLH